MNKDIYASSRICYIMEAAVEYFISLLITGAYLAKLTSALGFSDSLTAVLSSFVALGCSFQLFAIAFFKKGRVKRRVTILHILNQLLFMAIYLVPFFNIGAGTKTVLFIAFLLLGYFVSNIIFAPKTNWFMSLVPDGKRGIFTSLKETVSLIGGLLFQLIMGYLIDALEAKGHISAGFILCAVTIFVLMVIHTLTLVLAKEREPEERPTDSAKGGLWSMLTDKSILLVIGASVFWTISAHISTPFYGTYQIKELGFSMTFVAVLSALYAAVRVPCSIWLGKYADKISFAKMLKICYGIAALSFLAGIFTIPENGHVMYTLHHLLYAAAMGGINSAETNLIFDYVAPDKRSNTLAVKQTVYGLCGFLATLLVTPLVNYIQANGNLIWGIPIYAQQMLSAVSLGLVLLLILYVDKIILKIKPYGTTV